MLLLTDFDFQIQLNHIIFFDLFHFHFLTDWIWHLFKFNDCICFALLNNIYFFMDQIPECSMGSITNDEVVMAATIQQRE